MFKEKINRFIQEVAENEEAIEIMEDLIEACGSYVARVNALEAALITRRFRMDGNEYIKYINDLVNCRSKAHNAVVANIKILNRICLSNDIEIPIKCDVDNSIEVEDMAINLIDELFGTRKRYAS